MPTDEKKRHQLENILSDNVSIMDTEDLSYEQPSLETEEQVREGFCVECKDQEVYLQTTQKNQVPLWIIEFCRS